MPTLFDVLDGAKPNTKVKIGAVDGSSWFIVTTVKMVMDNANDIDKALDDYLKTRHQRAEEVLAQALRNPMDIKAYMAKQLVKHKSSIVPDFSWEGYMEEFKKYCSNLEAKRRTCIALEDAKVTAKPLMDREVVDVSKAIEEGYRILIEGNEEGLWWDSSERKKGDKIYGFRAVKDGVSDAE